MDIDIIKLADDWIRYRQKPKHRDDDPDVVANEEVDKLVREDILNGLRTIYRIAERTSDENILSVLGAGPLEDLLQSDHAAQHVGEIIVRTRQDKNFRFALGCVWTTSFKNKEVAQQIEKALNTFFPDGRP